MTSGSLLHCWSCCAQLVVGCVKNYESDNVETFLVGVQITNENEENIFKDNYKLLLNEDIQSLEIKGVDGNSKLVKATPLRSPWAKYFIISFENEEEKKVLELIFQHSRFGETRLTFKKD